MLVLKYHHWTAVIRIFTSGPWRQYPGGHADPQLEAAYSLGRVVLIIQDGLLQQTRGLGPGRGKKGSFYKPKEKCLFLQDPDICSQGSFRLFKAAENLGYEIFEPKLPLEQKKSCQNKNYTHDLLLIHKDVLSSLKNEKSKSVLFASKLVRDEF